MYILVRESSSLLDLVEKRLQSISQHSQERIYNFLVLHKKDLSQILAISPHISSWVEILFPVLRNWDLQKLHCSYHNIWSSRSSSLCSRLSRSGTHLLPWYCRRICFQKTPCVPSRSGYFWSWISTFHGCRRVLRFSIHIQRIIFSRNPHVCRATRSTDCYFWKCCREICSRLSGRSFSYWNIQWCCGIYHCQSSRKRTSLFTVRGGYSSVKSTKSEVKDVNASLFSETVVPLITKSHFGSGTLHLSGESVARFTANEVGTGFISTLSGAAESVTINPSEDTALRVQRNRINQICSIRSQVC